MEIDGKKLAEYRTRAGYSMRDLAAHTGISVATIDKWENLETARPFASKLKVVADFLGIRIEDLLPEAPAARKDIVDMLAAQLDEPDQTYFRKQFGFAREHLGAKFGIEDAQLLSAGLFGGFGWAKKGQTFSENYPAILGNMLALKGISITHGLPEKDGRIVLSETESIDHAEKLEAVGDMAAVYGVVCAKDKKIVRIGQSRQLKTRLMQLKKDIENREVMPTCGYLGECEFPRDFYFQILAVYPAAEGGSFAFQKEFWCSYMETRLILQEGTYELGNSCSRTGDPFIPRSVQECLMEACGQLHTVEETE